MAMGVLYLQLRSWGLNQNHQGDSFVSVLGNNGLLKGGTTGIPPVDIVFGRSPAMQGIRQKVEKIADANIPVLIQGKSGTGKEILARAIHARSIWGARPFVKVNCAAIPGTLLESELFGYQRGAFTGANTSKAGRVELAHQGTLFLDEIAELDPALQAKLLQFLQDGQFRRIGDEEDRRVEARVICATNRNLQEGIALGSFREDLFYRINVISIRMPDLSDRREDIAALTGYFLNHFNQVFEREAPAFSREAMRNFESSDWPGNIRELENLVARYVVLESEDALYDANPERSSSRIHVETAEDGTIPLKRIAKKAIFEMERNVILEALRAHQWNRRKTAQSLKISYRALIYKIRAAGLVSRRSAVVPQGRSAGAVAPRSSAD
jgi:two-component system, NtrC family, response regulator AtoC